MAEIRNPVSFSFSDGVDTINIVNDPNFPSFFFSTDATGLITAWSLTLLFGDEGIALDSADGAIGEFPDNHGVTPIPGSFVEVAAASPVPEPPSWPLMLTGVGIVAALHFRARWQKERYGKLRPE